MSDTPGRIAAVTLPLAVPTIAAAEEAFPGAHRLDVRAREAFAAGHAPRAGRVARSEFRERRMELPGRDERVLVMHDDPAEARAAALRLSELGYAHVAWLDAPLASEPEGTISRAPAVRLWSPSPFLERVLQPGMDPGVPTLPRGRALDLACGSGRASLFLAHAGFAVEGWDVDPSALELARAFATRERVAITFREVDLETVAPAPVNGVFDVIVVLRYLHRALFSWIEQALAPGGALVYETFRRGQERFGHPTRPRHLLEPGELRRAFPSLEVVLDEETPATAPPVLSRLLARRR